MIAKPIRPSRQRRNAALLASRVAGCTCSPNVKEAGGLVLRVEHDRDCPTCDAGRQLFVLGGAS
jgi:hypothetical protein